MTPPPTDDRWLAAAIVAAILFVRFVLIPDEIGPSERKRPRLWSKSTLILCPRCGFHNLLKPDDDCCPVCKLVL